MKHGLERQQNPWRYARKIKIGKRSKSKKQTKEVNKSQKEQRREVKERKDNTPNEGIFEPEEQDQDAEISKLAMEPI